MIALRYNGIIQEKFTVSEFSVCQQARQQWRVKGSYRKYLRNHLASLFCANLQLGKAREESEAQLCSPPSDISPCTPAFFSLPPSSALYSSLKQQRETGKVNRISCRTVHMKEFQVFDLTKVLCSFQKDWGKMESMNSPKQWESMNSPPGQKWCSPSPVIG